MKRILFFALMIFIGIRSRKHATDVNGFVLGSRSVGPWLSDTVPSSPLAFFRSAMPVLQRWETMFREKERGSVIREKGGAWKNDGIFYEKYFA